MKNRNQPENTWIYDHLPRELLWEIYRKLPNKDLFNMRLMGQRHKNIAETVFSEPTATIRILSSNLDISQLYVFLDCYRRTDKYQQWQSNTATIGSLRELLLYLLAFSNTPIDDDVISYTEALPATKQNDAIIVDSKLFLSLFNMLASPSTPDCAQRLMALVRYFRNTGYFAELQQRSQESLNDDEMLCLILATDDVNKLSMQRLQTLNVETPPSIAESSAMITIKCLMNFEEAQTTVLKEEPGIQPPYINLAAINLEGQTLTNINLSGANLENANLSNVIFNGVNCQFANLRNANLDSINVKDKSEGAAKTNLSFADLQGATLKSDKMNNIKLTGSTWISEISTHSISSLLKRVSINLKTIKAIVNNVIRLIKSDAKNKTDVETLESTLKKLPLAAYPFERGKVDHEIIQLKAKTKRLAR